MFIKIIRRPVTTILFSRLYAPIGKTVGVPRKANFSYHLKPVLLRNYSQQINNDLAPNAVTADYKYVKEAILNGNILIIDVREPDEIKEHGKIPNSINIPLGNISSTLSTMPDKEFEEIYQCKKPREDSEIIFYCMIGRRSGMAQQNAFDLGYKNVKNYLGSWTDWATKEQK